MATSNPYSDSLLMDALRGSMSNAESFGRGFAVAPVGLLGDIEGLLRKGVNFSFGRGGVNVGETPVLPTTEGLLSNIPRMTPRRMETAGMEQIGSAANPRGPVELAKGVGRVAGNAVNEAMVYGRGPLASITPQPMRIFVPASKEEAFQASKMLKTMTPQEVWQQTGIGKFGGEYQKELSDQSAKFNTAEDIAANAQRIRERNAELKQVIKESQNTYPDLFPKELTAARRPLREEIKANQGLLERNYGYESDPKWAGQLAQIAYEHPELYSVAPELKGVVIRQGREGGPYLGSYERIGSQPAGSVDVYGQALKTSPKSTATHEMQHAVQDLYGWQAGGTPEQFVSTQEVNDAKIVANLLGKGQQPSEAASWIRENLGRSPSPQVMDIAMNPSKLEFYKSSHTPFERYQRLAGEAQARLAQTRLDLTPEERLKYYPFEQQTKENKFGLDVNPEELIFNTGLLGR